MRQDSAQLKEGLSIGKSEGESWRTSGDLSAFLSTEGQTRAGRATHSIKGLEVGKSPPETMTSM